MKRGIDMKRKAYLVLLMAAVFWGGGFVATAIALDSVPVFSLLSIRFLVSAFILFFIYNKEIRFISLKTMKRTVPLGIFLFLAFFFQTKGNGITSVSNNSFLTALNVVFTPFIAMVALQSKPRRNDIIACILSLLGVVVLTFRDLDANLNIGDIYSIIGAIFFSCHVVYSSKLSDIRTQVATFMQMLVSGLVALVFSLIFEDFQMSSLLNSNALIPTAYLVIFSTLICYSIQLKASKVLEPSTVSVLLSTETLFATFFGITLLGEPLTVSTVLCMVLLASSVLISSYEPKKNQLEPS